jgi:hypothetical protein
MYAYRTHIVIVDSDHTELKGSPFRVGPCVVAVLLEEPEDSSVNKFITDISEKEWLRSVATNLVFDSLSDADEDVYSLSDGKSLKL